MHLDDEQVERLRHAELPRGMEDSIREHLAACEECRLRVTNAEDEEGRVYTLLRQLDHPIPVIDASTIAARARRYDFGRVRWAAGVLLLAAFGGAALAAPGLPLGEWLRVAIARIAPPPNPTRSSPTQVRPADAPLAGVALEPGRSLLILFKSEQSAGGARISLTDDAEVLVRAPTGAASFTSDAGRLVIENRASTAIFEIRIPREAPRVEIRVNGVRVYLKEGARVTPGNSPDSPDVYLLRLSLPRS